MVPYSHNEELFHRFEMKQNMRKRSPLAVLLALCLAMQLSLIHI